MSDYFEERLKERVRKRARPFQYLLAHIFLMVATLVMMSPAVEWGLITDDHILVVAITFVVTLIAHIFWRGSQFIWERIEQDEAEKLIMEGKPKRDRLQLEEDGEIVSLEDVLYDDNYAQQAHSR